MSESVRRKVDVDKLKKDLRKHAEELMKLKDRRGPAPGELAEMSLEEEFEG